MSEQTKWTPYMGYECGCFIIEGAAQFCKMHSAAPEMAALLERFVGIADQHQALLESDVEDTRALLARIKGRS